MSDGIMRREIREAMDAGERALNSLERAQDKLNSARSWGIFDMIGGGFMTSMIKHSRLDDAVRYMEDAKEDLKIFQRELRDVRVPAEFKMEIGGFLTFADFFFDGIVADYLVQSKIVEARREVAEAISRVSRLLDELSRMYD